MIRRLRHGLARYGLRGAIRRALELAKGRLFLQEEHIWYELPLEAERPARPLEPGLRLLEAGLEHLPLLGELPTLPPSEAAKLREGGGRLFFVLDADEPLFSCWIHERRTPVLAAPGGWLTLPPGVACLEDSVTAAAARGRGIAPAAWSALAGLLQEEGVRALITKVGVENAPSRRAVEKAGFHEVALMRLRRVGSRATVTVVGTTELASVLARLLGG